MRRRCGSLFEFTILMISVATVYLCSVEEFYNPYVRIKTKRGETFSSLYSSGFLDLSTVFGAVICINGPAVLYTGAQQDKTMKIQVYDEGFLNVYVHRCHSFNEIETEALAKNLKEKQYHKNKQRKPTVLSDNIKIRGIKIYGVTLVSGPYDYRLPEIYQFNHPNLGHNVNNETVVGTSFAVIGNENCWCTVLPVRHPSEEIHKITICSDAKWNSEVCDILAGRNKFSELFADEYIRSRPYTWRTCRHRDVTAKPDLHVFEPFSVNLPLEVHRGKIIGHPNQISSKPTVRHHWEAVATNCIEFPTYTYGNKC